MPPSSLIFVLIVAIWAAYLLQHWIRRRDHLATARSVDRFSEAMRVLERRRPLPQSSLAPPESRSYAVSPARPVRAEVVIKRARPAAPDPVATGSTGMVRLTNPAMRLLSWLTLPRVRRLSLLLAMTTVLLAVVLASVGVVAWWPVLAALVILTLDLAWLRQGVLAQRRAQRTHAARVVQRVRSRRVAAAQLIDVPATASALGPADLVDQSSPVTISPLLLPDEELSILALVDRGWQPVPVPPPTYTLKAKAPERPWVEPAAVTATPRASGQGASGQGTSGQAVGRAEPFDRLAGLAGEPAEAADRDATRAADGAGTAYGVGGLPLDGLALDEELEELPAAYATG